MREREKLQQKKTSILQQQLAEEAQKKKELEQLKAQEEQERLEEEKRRTGGFSYAITMDSCILMEDIESDKVILPPWVLDDLTKLPPTDNGENVFGLGPIYFQVKIPGQESNGKTNSGTKQDLTENNEKITHAGVLEFSLTDGSDFLPQIPTAPL